MNSSIQFSSISQSCPTLCDPMDYCTPDLPVYHQLSEFTQTHVYCRVFTIWAALVAQRLKCLPAMQETWVRSLGLEDPLEKKWQPTPVFLPEESHGRRILVGYSPCGHKESDMTELLHFLFSCPLSRWCHPTISSSVMPFSSCLQSFPALESFPMSWLFASGVSGVYHITITSLLFVHF